MNKEYIDTIKRILNTKAPKFTRGGPLFKGDLTPYVTPARAMLRMGEVSPEDLADTVSRWRACTEGWRGLIIPVSGLDALYMINADSDGDLRLSLKPKPYRVFYRHGVYEWYVNTGSREYTKRGELVGAYNARAGIWAQKIYL